MAVTLMELVNAVRDTLATAEGLKGAWSQAEADIKESIPPGDLPLLQVYLATGETSKDSNTDRITFSSGVSPYNPIRHFDALIRVDVYARQRSYMEEDLRASLIIANAVYNVLDTQNLAPYFGHDGIKAFRFDMQFVNFVYGSQPENYTGYRFELEITVF